MELQLNKKNCSYLHTHMHQVQNLEQTQELRLPEEMPDVGRVLCAWGQSVIRSKQWRSDGILVSGGVTVSALYVPEDSMTVQSVDCWIPFQGNWNLPSSTREGIIRVQCLVRNVEARMVSARKLMLRASVDILAEALEHTDTEIYYPGDLPEGVEVLTDIYPVILPKEAGEKQFFVEEEIKVPDAAKWISFHLDPKITEQNVVGSRVVMRGNGLVHYVYMDIQGSIRNGSKEITFAQFADLDGEYDKEATADVILAISSMETEATSEGVRLQCGLVAQYLVQDRVLLVLAEDAYSPSRHITVSKQLLSLPLELDNRTESLEAQNLFQGGRVLNMTFMPQEPIVYQQEDMAHIEVAGNFQYLYQDYDGTLQGTVENWNGKISLPAADHCQLRASIRGVDTTGAFPRVFVHIQTCANQKMPMICQLQIGEKKVMEEDRPSLILQRIEGDSLWELAKSTGSTMAAIRKANHLSQDPMPGQMLLIPIA